LMQLKLTSKERLVLYGLARYPGLSDIDLATRIDVDRSTIFKSKRKFRDWQLIRLMNVPSGITVGGEILTSIFAKFSPTAPIEVRSESEALLEWIGHPNCVFHTATDTESFSMVYSRSLSDFKSSFDPLIDEYAQKGFIDDIICSHYPFASTNHSADAAVAVNRIFELDRPDLPQELISESSSQLEDMKLTDKDKLTLYAFVKYPMLSDLELSRRTGISRPTISGKRTKFFQNGLLTREANIDWQKICCELITFYRLELGRGVSWEEQETVHTSLRRMGAPLFTYLQRGEAFGAFLSENYTDLKNKVNAEIRTLAEMALIDDPPMLMTMPLDMIVESKRDYAPMVAGMLGIEKEI